MHKVAGSSPCMSSPTPERKVSLPSPPQPPCPAGVPIVAGPFSSIRSQERPLPDTMAVAAGYLFDLHAAFSYKIYLRWLTAIIKEPYQIKTN